MADIIGTKPKLRVGSSFRHKTIIGGLLCVLIYISVVVELYFFGIDLFYKTNPKALLATEYDENPQRINTTIDKFQLMVLMNDNSGTPFVDESVYTIDMFLWNKTFNEDRTLKITKTPLKTKFCNESEDDKWKEQFKNLDKSKSYCIDRDTIKEKNIDLFLQGYWYSEILSQIQIKVKPCVNGTKPGITCKSKEEIYTKLKGGNFEIDIINYVFDASNYTHPSRPILKNLFTTYSISYTKDFIIYFRSVDFKTDDGFLLADEKIERFHEFSYAQEYTSFGELSGGVFFSCVLRLDQYRPVYKRTYKKLQEVLAEISSFYFISLVIVKHVYSFFESISFNQFLASYVCSFGIEIVKENEVEGRNLSTELISFGDVSSTNKDNVNIIKFRDSSSDVKLANTANIQTKEKQKSPKIIYTDKLKLKCRDIWKLAFCHKNQKAYSNEELNLYYYSLAMQRISNTLDIRKLMLNISEIETLVKILLTRDQQNVFKLLNIVKDTSNEEVCLTQSLEHFSGKFKTDEEIEKSVKKLINDQDLTSIALIRLLGKEVSDVFPKA